MPQHKKSEMPKPANRPASCARGSRTSSQTLDSLTRMAAQTAKGPDMNANFQRRIQFRDGLNETPKSQPFTPRVFQVPNLSLPSKPPTTVSPTTDHQRKSTYTSFESRSTKVRSSKARSAGTTRKTMSTGPGAARSTLGNFTNRLKKVHLSTNRLSPRNGHIPTSEIQVSKKPTNNEVLVPAKGNTGTSREVSTSLGSKGGCALQSHAQKGGQVPSGRRGHPVMLNRECRRNGNLQFGWKKGGAGKMKDDHMSSIDWRKN